MIAESPQNNSHYLGMMSNNENIQKMSALVELTNEDTLIEKVRYILSGEKHYWDPETQQRVTMQIDLRILTSYGVQRLIKHLSGYLTKNITTSFHTQKQINIICRQFHTQTCFENAENWIAYGFRSKTEHNQVTSLLGNHVRSTYNRSLDGLTLIKTLENTQVQELRNFEGEKKEGGLSSIFRRKAS